MAIPESYYYLDTQSQQLLDDEPSGEIDIDALIQGETKYWVNLGLQDIEKPKMLILSDWTIKNWPSEKVQRVSEKLLPLIEQGFSIYYNHSGRIQELSKKHIINLERSIDSMSTDLTHPQDLKQIVYKQLDFIHDKVEILDDYSIESLINSSKEDVSRGIKLSDCSTFDKEQMKQLVAQLRQAIPPVTNILIDKFEEKNTYGELLNTQIQFLKDSFPDATVTIDYSHARLKHHHLYIIKFHENIYFNEYSININQFNKLNHLSLEYDSTGSIVYIHMINKVFPNLISVQLSNLQEHINHITFNQDTLANLEHAAFTNSKCNSTTLKQILESATKLKTINLGFSTIFDGYFYLEPNSLPNLERISLRGTKISTANLNTLLAAASNLQILNLEEIELNDSESIYDATDSNLAKLENLNELIITNENMIDSNYLQLIAYKLPNLKTITITSNGDRPEPKFYCPVNEAKVLNIESTRLENSALDLILDVESTSIEILRLTSCIFVDKKLEIRVYSYNSISELELEHTNINLVNLETLVKYCPGLKILKLTDNSKLTIDDIQSLHADYPNLIIYYNNGYELSGEAQSHTLEPEKELHSLDEFRHFKPDSDVIDFEYKGQNKTQNQGMFIEKLSQYLTLTGHYLSIIPKIQKGMCNVLTHYFKQCGQKQWEEFTNKIAQWNGKLDTLNPQLIDHFEKLLEQTQLHQFHPNPPAILLGDDLDPYLDQIHDSCLLYNAWHAIAIKPLDAGKTYLVYDPNYTSGARIVAKSELKQSIQSSLGSIIQVESPYSAIPKIQHPDKFIEEGGLLSLFQCENRAQVLAQISSGFNYPLQSLDGLFLRSTSGIPAWVRGLQSNNASLRIYTCKLLLKFCAEHPDYQSVVSKSMEHVSGFARQECCALILQSITNHENSPLVQNLLQTINTSSEYVDYETRLKTWLKKNRHMVPSKNIARNACK